MSHNDELRAHWRGIVAQGWCAPLVSNRVMDPDLAEAITDAVLRNLTTPPAATRAVDELERLDAALAAYGRADYEWTQRDKDSRDEPRHRFAMRAAIAALHQAAPDAQGAVDDAMVERAERVRVKTLNKLTAYGSAGVAERHQMAMHAALEAALTPPTGGPAHG